MLSQHDFTRMRPRIAESLFLTGTIFFVLFSFLYESPAVREAPGSARYTGEASGEE